MKKGMSGASSGKRLEMLSGAIGVPFSGESPPPLSAFKPNSSLCYDRQLILDLFFMAA
jgi:hypothetical protein